MFRHLFHVSDTSGGKVMIEIGKWRPFWTPSWILKNRQGGFSGTFSQWFNTYSWNPPEKISLFRTMSTFWAIWANALGLIGHSMLDQLFLYHLNGQVWLKGFEPIRTQFIPHLLQITKIIFHYLAAFSASLEFVNGSNKETWSNLHEITRLWQTLFLLISAPLQ